MTDETYSTTDQIECPWCGEMFRDLWEFDEGYHEHECGHCGRPVTLVKSLSVSYTAKKASGQ